LKKLKKVPYNKKAQRLLARLATDMVAFIAKLYAKKYQETTAKEEALFKDASGYGKVFEGFNVFIKKQVFTKYSDDFLNTKVRSILLSSDGQAKAVLYENISEAVGISPKTLMAREGMARKVDSLILSTQKYITSLRDDSLKNFSNNALRLATQGGSLSSIIREMQKNGKEYKNSAKFVAMQQIKTFNAISNKMRYSKLGIEEAIWDTSNDGRERACHRVRDGKVFELSKGLYSACDGKYLLPGVDFGCRCNFRAIMPDNLKI
jgi:SPP1 gp7 family putative phage head morphogenesis protein